MMRNVNMSYSKDESRARSRSRSANRNGGEEVREHDKRGGKIRSQSDSTMIARSRSPSPVRDLTRGIPISSQPNFDEYHPSMCENLKRSAINFGNRILGGSSKKDRAGLIFPVTRIRNQFKDQFQESMGDLPAVYLAAVMEYLVSEVLDIAGMNCKRDKRRRILPRDIRYATLGDSEICQFVTSENSIEIFMPTAGTFQHIHAALYYDRSSSKVSGPMLWNRVEEVLERTPTVPESYPRQNEGRKRQQDDIRMIAMRERAQEKIRQAKEDRRNGVVRAGPSRDPSPAPALAPDPVSPRSRSPSPVRAPVRRRLTTTPGSSNPLHPMTLDSSGHYAGHNVVVRPPTSNSVTITIPYTG